MIKQTIHENWTVRAVSNFSELPGNIRDASIPAQVPGCVHTDLLRGGLIDDPYFGQNELKLKWIGDTDWQYRTTFDADVKLFDHERIDLVCDGLDTIAKIELNGSLIAQTINMHRGYRFDVRKHLRKGSNELVITFASPVNYCEQLHKELGHWPATSYGGKFNYIRKMACNFGWDWGPVVPTSGIWRAIRLEGWSIARMASISPSFVDHNPIRNSDVQITAEFEFAQQTTPRAKDLLRFRGSLISPEGDVAATGGWTLDEKGNAKIVALELQNPSLWWPAGHGPQSRYLCKIELSYVCPEGTIVLDSWEKKLGLRRVELDTSADDIGRKFVLKVNGQPIFCKGFNWIPDDCFLDRACDPTRVRKRIQQALDTNANMLRVWGGGIYETDDFYDICDEMGMLVWQDFLFACAAYPEVEPLKSEVEAEARYNIARLSHHPSLVLWNGCNENIWGYHVWSHDDGHGVRRPWKEQLKNKGWGPLYYLEMLPRIVKELDPSRPYWEASPWSGDPDVENGLHPNLSTHGNKHIWEVWHGPGDYNNYRWYSPRFCSEFGYQGPPNFSTMKKFYEPSEMKRGSATLELHQKSPAGNDRNDRLVQKDFDLPENFDDWNYLLQLNQARALQTGVEWFRSRQPVCMGTLYWQLNDCYPVTSWSAIDSEGQLKPLWYATRRFYAPRLLTIQPEADAIVLYANNDSDQAWQGEATVRRIDFNGKELSRIVLPVNVDPRGNQRVAVLPTGIVTSTDKAREMIVAEVGDHRATWFFASDRDLVYPSAKPQAELRRDSAAWRLSVSTKTLLRDVVMNIDRLDPAATIEDNVVTLLPGESREFVIHSEKELTLDQLMNPPVFQCANRFGKKA